MRNPGFESAHPAVAAVWPGDKLVDFFPARLSYLCHRITNWDNACSTLSTEPGTWHKRRLSLGSPNALWFLYLHCIVLRGTKQAGLKILGQKHLPSGSIHTTLGDKRPYSNPASAGLSEASIRFYGSDEDVWNIVGDCQRILRPTSKRGRS